MANESMVAIYDTFADAASAVRQLDLGGFPHDQVSLVSTAADDRLTEESVQAGDESENKAAAGAAMGGLLGMLVGFPLLMIPGIGLLLLAGPIATGMTGALVGGFLGSMTGWGIHSDHVAEYQQRVREGKVLVVLHGHPGEMAKAEQIVRDTHPTEFHLHAPDSADSEEISAT